MVDDFLLFWFFFFLLLLPHNLMLLSLAHCATSFWSLFVFTFLPFNVSFITWAFQFCWIGFFFLQFCYLKRGLSYIHCHVVQPNKTCILFLARKYFYGRKKNKKLNFTGKNKILCVRKFHHNSPPVLTSLVIIFSCQLFNLFYLKKKLFNIILLKNMIYSFESIVLSFIFGASSCNPKIF